MGIRVKEKAPFYNRLILSLERERHSPIKHEYHEYIDGEVYAIAGTTKAHNIISLNLAFLLLAAFKGSPCQIFMADVKVSISNNISNQKNTFIYQGNESLAIDASLREIYATLDLSSPADTTAPTEETN